MKRAKAIAKGAMPSSNEVLRAGLVEAEEEEEEEGVKRVVCIGLFCNLFCLCVYDERGRAIKVFIIEQGMDRSST